LTSHTSSSELSEDEEDAASPQHDDDDNDGADDGDAASEEAVDEVIAISPEIITTEQEYQQTQMEETTWEQLQELKRAKDKDTGSTRTIRQREDFFRLRRGSDGAGGGGGGRGDDKEEDDMEPAPTGSDDGLGMQIFVKLPAGYTITLDVEAFDTIGTIKAVIKNKEGIPRADQRLIFADKDMDNRDTLYECNIVDGSKLVLLMALTGGGGVKKTALKGGAASANANKSNPFKDEDALDVLGARDGEAVVQTIQGLYSWTQEDAKFFVELSKMPKSVTDSMLTYLSSPGKHRSDVRIKAVLEMTPLFLSGHALIKKLKDTMTAIEKSFGSQIWEAVMAQSASSDTFSTDVFRLLVQASSV
jgi:hypothetical protein